ncbi:MAG: hypothetical protein IT578_07400 [Verrucomicrobiae bacterium]|nr:hypothetical protein [Verrucomicrobiae bacterium]
MQENIEAERKGKRAGSKGRRERRMRKVEEKLGLVRLHLEEGHTLAMVSQETGG